MLEIHLVWFRKLRLRLHFVQGCCQVCCFRFKSHWHFLTAEPSNKRCNYAICWECVLLRERLQFGAVSFRLRACAWLRTHNNFHPIKAPTICCPFFDMCCFAKRLNETAQQLQQHNRMHNSKLQNGQVGDCNDFQT